MQRMSLHNNAPLKGRNLHHLSLSLSLTGSEGKWDCESGDCCSRDALVGALWRGAFRGLFALCFSTPLKHCWKLWGVERAGANCLLGRFWAGCRYRGTPIHRPIPGSGTRQQGTQRGQIVCLVAFGAGGRAWSHPEWLLQVTIQYHSLKETYQRAAMPMILQNTFHRLTCLLGSHIRPTNIIGAQVPRYSITQVPRHLSTQYSSTSGASEQR